MASIYSLADAGRTLALGAALHRPVCAPAVSAANTAKPSGRAHQRLVYEAMSLALQSREALQQQRPGWVGLSVNMMGDAPTVAPAKVTDPAGNVLFISKGDADESMLEPDRARADPADRQRRCRQFPHAIAAIAGNALIPSILATRCAALPGLSSTSIGARTNQLHPSQHRYLRCHLDDCLGDPCAAHGPFHLATASHAAPRHIGPDALARRHQPFPLAGHAFITRLAT